MPLLTFCWMKYIASANCSLLNFPVCLVSARALGETRDAITHAAALATYPEQAHRDQSKPLALSPCFPSADKPP